MLPPDSSAPQTPELRKEAVVQVLEAGGVQLLETLLDFVDTAIRELASEILDTYLRERDCTGVETDQDADDEAESGHEDS